MSGDPLFDLSGRVAVVTGGMGQLGRVIRVGARRARDARRRPRRGPGRRARGGAGVRGGRHGSELDRGRRAGDRAGLGSSAPSREQRSARLASGRTRRGGRPVRGLPRGLVRRGHGRERQGNAPVLPGDRRRDGARGARLDRERLVGLRPSLARAGSVRVPARTGRDVLQARRLLGLEVRRPQPHALPRDVLGEGRRPREHAHARGGLERPGSGVPRGVRGALADGADAERATRRSARSSSSPRTRRRTSPARTSSSTAAGPRGSGRRPRPDRREAGPGRVGRVARQAAPRGRLASLPGRALGRRGRGCRCGSGSRGPARRGPS